MTKRGDTNAITFTVKGDDKQPVALSGTIRVVAKALRTGEVVELAVTPGPTTGTLVHQLTGTLDADTYHVEVKETDGGVITKAPGVGYYTLVIEPDLG